MAIESSKINNWDKHFKELENLQRLDDFDFYSKYSDNALKDLLKQYRNKRVLMDYLSSELKEKLNQLKHNINLIDVETSLIERKILGKK